MVEAQENTPKWDMLARVRDRYFKMRTERTKLESEWTTSEQQVDAPSYLDNDGKILYNAQTEQSLCEQYVGRVNNQIYWDMKPEQEAEAAEIYASQKILNYFMEKEGFYRELAMWDYSKSIYGIGIWFTWLTLFVEKKYKPKEWAEIEGSDISGWIDSDDLFEEYTQYNRQFTPKNVRPRDFYWDNRYFWQDDWKLVEDCIMVEYISKETLEERWWEDKRYNISWLEERAREDRSNWWSSHLNVIKLWHYYDRKRKDYVIIGNECQVIRATKMKYKSGKLPFEVAQHFPDNRCICGRGIPRKTRASKAYKNNMIQAALDKTWSSAFANIVLGKNNVLNNKYQVWGWINIWELNSTADFTQFQSDSNISGLQIAIELMNTEIAVDTGEDVKAAFEINPQEKLGQTEIKEENKAIRLKTVMIARDIALDNALTFAYQNIQQFAPIVLRKEEKIDGKTIKVVRPVISLPGIKVIKKGNKQMVEDIQDYWYYGWYELNPKYRMIDGTVKIVTNSTYNKPGSVLEKNKFTELVDNYVKLAQFFGPEVMKKMPVDTVLDLMNQAYWYDPDMKFTAKTKKDKTVEKNAKLIEYLKNKFSWWLLPSNQMNENPNQQAMGGMPGWNPAAQSPAEIMWWTPAKAGAATSTEWGWII